MESLLREYVGLVAKSALKENLRIRLEPTIKDRWDTFLGRKKITQQAAVVALVEMVMKVDGRLASMILGQIEPEHHAEMVEMLLKHFAQPVVEDMKIVRNGAKELSLQEQRQQRGQKNPPGVPAK